MEAHARHVIFGYGQVGSHLAERLVARGIPVRVISRSASTVTDGAEVMNGDATDATFCSEAVDGAAVVYHCMNPPYSTKVWSEVLPVLQANLIAAAGSAGARLVVLENLYMVGTGGGKPISEETEFNPVSRKGEIRAVLAEELSAAYRRGDVQGVSGRASDFYGPGGFGTHFGERFWVDALRGKPAPFLPDPETPHTYHFIPDVAEGLIRLGLGPVDTLGSHWMLPCAPAESSSSLITRFSKHLGSDIVIRGMPRFMIKAVGLVIPMLRELEEMLHQWETPFVVDDSRFRAQFGMQATDLDAGAHATVAWAKTAFGH